MPARVRALAVDADVLGRGDLVGEPASPFMERRAIVEEAAQPRTPLQQDDPQLDTAFAILFLKRATRPLVESKAVK